jgi:hypothetical protein
MKKYGRKRQHPGNLPDNHPQKGFVNWWERDYHSGKSKKRARVEASAEIAEERVNITQQAETDMPLVP